MIFEEDRNESEEELQEAFAAGKLKPGLNIPTNLKKWKNNVVGLEQKLEDIKLKLPWVERLDINTAPALMAPEMFHEITEQEKNSVVKLKTVLNPGASGKMDGSLALDDFKREMLFHRQAQAALIEGVKRLTALGIPTRRPDDYFAEMAKSDEHMHKVRESLSARQKGVVRAERVGQLRRQRKLSKQTQIENRLNQAKEKKKMLTEVQKFRKGVRKDLDFLDGKDKPSRAPQRKGNESRGAMRKTYKDKKFGFGGKKSGSKRNTKDSLDGGQAWKSKGFGRGGGASGKGAKSGKGGNKNQRPGKSKRMRGKGRK